jgi:hypothetical protein
VVAVGDVVGRIREGNLAALAVQQPRDVSLVGAIAA